MCYSRPTAYVYRRNFASIGLFYRPVAAKNRHFCGFLPFFGLRHLVMSPIVINLRKVSTGAQLQTFPYPMASKSFLYSNAFMAKSGAQSLTFKRVTDKQTNRQTSRLVFTVRLRPQVRMPPVRNARRTSCPIPSSERVQIPNFRTRSIPNL